MFGSGKGRQATVGKDSFNTTMPEAVNEEMSDKMTAMNQRFDDHGSLTAVGGIGEEVEQKDSVADAYQGSEADATLIRAMIDQTTKAREGTRLRFKLLDDVMVKDVKLRKGTYLYGIVSGFGQQRVMANITSILVGGRFLTVNLSVYDNDGMEGFYVPESAFRDMMREAGAQSLQNNMSFSGGYGSELSGEAVALQALQNMYQSATNTLSAKMRQNKARIKYNTIIYLINKENRE